MIDFPRKLPEQLKSYWLLNYKFFLMSSWCDFLQEFENETDRSRMTAVSVIHTFKLHHLLPSAASDD